MNILIVGGSRFVGPLVVDGLLNKGHRVTVFNRGEIQKTYKDGIDFIKGDRDEGFSIKKHFNVVIDMCSYNGRQTKQALKDLSFDFLIHFSTAAAYKKTEIFPLTEDSNLGEWPIWGDYNKGKVECEKVLQTSGKNFAIIRPVYILGSNNYVDRENFIYSRINKGQSIMIPGNGQAVCQFAFSEDIARILIFLTEKRLKGAFNCASDEVITLRGLVQHMASLVGKKTKIEYDSSNDGENFDENEFPFANENFLVSNDKLRSLDITFTPLLKGLKKDYDSYYKNLLK